jgi:uncharacterized protein YoxC
MTYLIIIIAIIFSIAIIIFSVLLEFKLRRDACKAVDKVLDELAEAIKKYNNKGGDND